MADEELLQGPLIGRVGVQLVSLDLLIGVAVLPLSALVRHIVGNIPLELELLRPPLWLGSAASALLWPIAVRVVDPGYPSVRLPLRRLAGAAVVWILATSGVIYLLDKDLASRLLILLGAALALGVAALVRGIVRGVPAAAQTEHLPQLSAAAERALSRGEPVSLDLSRIGIALTRPTIVYEGERIWIYPSALSPIERLAKRALDIVLSLLILAVAVLPMLLIAALILIFDGRPILYHDQRAGLFGRPFSMRKFRTMRAGADAERAALWQANDTKGPAFKLANDPRVSGIGKFLRRFSLDELPQIVDVLQGRMSLVGPRPAGLDEVERYEDRHRLRLTVRPGVTGLWQIRRRFDVDFEQRIDDDLEYIRRWSPLLDLTIVIRSVGAVIAGRGV